MKKGSHWKMLLGVLCALFSCSALSANPTEKISENYISDDSFSQESFLKIQSDVQNYLIRTPLVPLPTLSKMIGRPVYLKDESLQRGNSFKTRGVTYEVFTTIENIIQTKPELLKKGLQLVTQTDGNHGIALILAITSAIEKYSALHPELKDAIQKIEPVIFTYKNVLSVKREGMDKAMAHYRSCVSHDEQGKIYDSYKDYGDAKVARVDYIAKSQGQAIYMEHGGIKTMQGHGIAALEILEQLKANGAPADQKVCLLLPIGAGGPIGLAAALKAFSPTSSALMIQTPRYDAFIRSFRSGKMEQNDSHLSPFTVEVEDNGKIKPVIYEDGISVDSPESEAAIALGIKFLDDAIYADAPKALQLAPSLLGDLDHYYAQYNQSEGIVGGTTAIVAEALLTHLDSKFIQEADVIVLFGTEGSIDPAIARYTRKLLQRRND